MVISAGVIGRGTNTMFCMAGFPSLRGKEAAEVAEGGLWPSRTGLGHCLCSAMNWMIAPMASSHPTAGRSSQGGWLGASCLNALDFWHYWGDALVSFSPSSGPCCGPGDPGSKPQLSSSSSLLFMFLFLDDDDDVSTRYTSVSRS